MMANEDTERAGSPVDHQWWDALKERRLTFQLCDACNASVFYPREVCPQCLSSRLKWKTSSGKGTVYSFTRVHRGPPAPGLKAPYVVALVELEEGFRMLAPLTGAGTDAVSVGSPVEFTVMDIPDDETRYPRFRLV